MGRQNWAAWLANFLNHNNFRLNKPGFHSLHWRWPGKKQVIFFASRVHLCFQNLSHFEFIGQVCSEIDSTQEMPFDCNIVTFFLRSNPNLTDLKMWLFKYVFKKNLVMLSQPQKQRSYLVVKNSKYVLIDFFL